MLHSDLPPHEKTPERLFQEAQVIVGGGILTTSWALTIAGFHIADKPHVFQKLRAELLQAIPDLMAPLDF
jgi:cytochrome P450